MRLRPASWPWLLAHEMRLTWRGFGGDSDASRTRTQVFLTLGGIVWLLLHLLAWFAMGRLSLDALGPLGIAIAGAVTLFALSVVLSLAIYHAVGALFDRGDLDLLMSAPLPTERVFIVRGLGIATAAMLWPAVLVLPFVHMGIARGQWQMALAYPVLVAFGLGAAGAGLGLTLVLVRWLGARRARIVAQILSAFVGAALVLGWQIPNLSGREARGQLWGRMNDALAAGWIGENSLLWWPARALLGDGLPALAIVGASLAFFLLVVRVTREIFLTGTQEAGVAAAPLRHRDSAAPFRSGLARNILRKEVTLIRRDPNLIAQILLQTLYVLPLVFVLGRNRDAGFIVGPALIVMLAQVAGNLAWIAISGEEAPDLLGSAPVGRNRVRWLKAAAALVLPAAAALPIVAVYVLRSPWLALVFAVFLVLALAAAAVTQVWAGKPAPQRDLKQRKQNVLINLLELLAVAGIAGGCYLAMNESWWALLPTACGLLGPTVAYFSGNAD